MRGTRLTKSTCADHERIIPAYAGNTALYVVGTVEAGDHPRVCGEHVAAYDVTRHWGGSSPRMRGTLMFGGIVLCEYGIIPAYAGNTLYPTWFSLR